MARDSVTAVKHEQKDLEFISMLANEGRIKPVIEKYFTLDKAAEAVR